MKISASEKLQEELTLALERHYSKVINEHVKHEVTNKYPNCHVKKSKV